MAEWYELTLFMHKSDREAFNFIARLRCRPSTDEKKTLPLPPPQQQHTWSDFLDLAALPHSILLPDENDDPTTTAWEGEQEYFGFDQTKVRCPVPIDLSGCCIPPHPPESEASTRFCPLPAADSSTLFYRDLEHALIKEQLCTNPSTQETVLPTWSAFLQHMFSAYDQIVEQYLTNHDDLVLVKCVTRDLVFALVRHRGFSPVTAAVMYVIVGLCYYIAAVNVCRDKLGIWALADPETVLPLPPRTPTTEGSAIQQRKARTPPAPSSRTRVRTHGRVTFSVVPAEKQGTVAPFDDQTRWALATEWNDHILPFSVFRFTAVQHFVASTGQWFHYTGLYAAIGAYFGYTVQGSQSLRMYQTWMQKFFRSYHARDPHFKQNNHLAVEKAVRAAVNGAFKAWYIHPKIADTIRAYDDIHGPTKFVDGAVKRFAEGLKRESQMPPPPPPPPRRPPLPRSTAVTDPVTAKTTTISRETVTVVTTTAPPRKRPRMQAFVIGPAGNLERVSTSTTTTDGDGDACAR